MSKPGHARGLALCDHDSQKQRNQSPSSPGGATALRRLDGGDSRRGAFRERRGAHGPTWGHHAAGPLGRRDSGPAWFKRAQRTGGSATLSNGPSRARWRARSAAGGMGDTGDLDKDLWDQLFRARAPARVASRSTSPTSRRRAAWRAPSTPRTAPSCAGGWPRRANARSSCCSTRRTEHRGLRSADPARASGRSGARGSELRARRGAIGRKATPRVTRARTTPRPTAKATSKSR